MADQALGWKVSEVAWEGPEERLNQTQQTQPCLVATSLACLAALRAALARTGVDLQPAFVAGHSVGEYAALVAAGVLAAADAIRLVARRGELMACRAAWTVAWRPSSAWTAMPSPMPSVPVAGPTDLVVANDNAPGQVVISGTRAALTDAAEASARRPAPAASSRCRCRDRSTRHGWRRSAMRWPRPSRRSNGRMPTPPVVSNVTAEPVTDAERIRNLLAEQVRSPVEWVAGGPAHGGRRRRHLHRVRAGCGPDRHGEAHRARGAHPATSATRPRLAATVAALGAVPAEASA